MTSKLEMTKVAVNRAVEQYAEMDVIRVAVQAIPGVGGAIDTILSGRASKIQMRRLERFMGQLHARLTRVELVRADVDSDEFADFMLTCLDRVWRARTAEKSKRFADVVATQVSRSRSWDEAEMAMRLVSDLEDIHIDILAVALAAPSGTGAFAGVKVVALKARPGETLLDGLSYSLLEELDSHHSPLALRLACSELTARGLLHDEGVGRWDGEAMTYFVATDLAVWLSEWLDQARTLPATNP